MDPQRVQCQNCGGKLAIRSEKFLGKIVACPRCHQPVRIPLTFNDAVHGDIPHGDSQALTSVDIEALQHAAPNQPIPAGEQTTNSFEDDFGGVEAALAAVSTFAPETEPVDPFSELTNEADANSEERLDSHPLPKPEPLPQVPTVSHQRKLYIWGGVAVGICLLSIGMLFAFLRTMRQETQIAQANPNKVAPINIIDGDDAKPADAKPEEVAKAAPPAQANAQIKPEATNANEAATKDEPPAPAEAIPPRDQSLNFLLQPKGDNPTDPAAQEAPLPEPSAEMPDEFKKWSNLFDPGSMPAMPEAKVLNREDVDGGAGYAAQSEIGVFYHPDVGPLPNWEDLKNTTVVSLEIPNLPLPSAMSTLASIYGAPCAWDVQGLSLQSIDFEKRVTKNYKDTTLEAVYVDLLAEYGLTLNSQPGELPRIEASRELASDVQQDIAITELGGGVTGEAWLGFFKTMFDDAADQLTLQADRLVFGEALTINQRRQIVNVAAQIQHIKQSKTATGGQQLTALHSQELSTTFQALKRPGAVAFARRTPAVMALTEAAQEFDLPLIVDWNACWQHGFTPHANTNFLTKNRNFPQISRFVLDQFALVIAIDPLGRLIMTTAPAQREMVQYRVVPIAEPTTLQTLRQAVLPLWPKGVDGKSLLKVQALPTTDPKPSMAVIRICAPSLTQLSESALLTALNLESSN